MRLPLELVDPDGSGLALPRRRARAGVRPRPCSARAAGRGASGSRLLRTALGWARGGFAARRRTTRGRVDARPAERGATRPDRAAVRRRAQHAGRRRPAAPSSCACCATPCSRPRAGRPAAAARTGSRARCCRSPRCAWLEAAARSVRLGASRASGSSATAAGWQRRRRAPSTRSCSPAAPVEAARLAGAARRPPGRRSAGGVATTSRSSPSTCTAPAARLPRADVGAAPRRRRTGAVRLRPRASSAAPAGLLAFVDQRRRAPGSSAASPPPTAATLRPGARGAALPHLDASRSTCCDHGREARDLPLHARARPPADRASRPACQRPATMSTAPTRPRSRAPSVRRGGTAEPATPSTRLSSGCGFRHAKESMPMTMRKTRQGPDHSDHPGARAHLRAARRAGLASGAGVAEADQRAAPACTLRPRTAS